jgi:hypothetical protein
MRTIVQRMRKGNRQGSFDIYDPIKTKLKYTLCNYPIYECIPRLIYGHKKMCPAKRRGTCTISFILLSVFYRCCYTYQYTLLRYPVISLYLHR